MTATLVDIYLQFFKELRGFFKWGFYKDNKIR